MLDRLGDFQLLELLGEGGMGTVYRARQESLARDVAVKVLPERLTASPKFIQRFYREARSAAGLVHPNVVQIYSLGQDEDRGVHYYAMEYVRGQDLAQVLRSGVRFSVDQALAIVIQVGEALAVAAEAGIIHRDIKPANVMLTAKGQVKVMDFGLAKMAVGDALDVTEAGVIVGTANYMSPEQGLGQPLDFRTDIYSLGVVFYELLAGRVPFKADDPSAVIYMQIYEPPKRPAEFNPKVPPAVDRLVLRMLAKQPEGRFASAVELLAELRKLKRSLSAPPGGRAAPDLTLAVQPPRPASKPAPTPPPAPARKTSSPPSTKKVSGRLRAATAGPAPARKASGRFKAAAPGPAVARQPAVPPTPPPAPAAPPAPSAPLRTIEERARAGAVAICDASDYTRRMYRAALGDQYALAAASSGGECLELVAEGRPDVLILDLALRDTGGFAVLDRLRQEQSPVAVVVITAESSRAALEQLGRYQVAAVLVKPVKLRELRRRVAEVIAARRGRARGAPAGPTAAFLERAASEEAAERARLSLAALAERLLERLPGAEAGILARRINASSPNQVVKIVGEIFAKFGEAEALGLIIFAFKEGDHRVRILAAGLVTRRFGPGRAAELLTRFAADPDYRVRIAALRELATSGADGVAGFLERFLTDESWKVRREAARGLEALAGGAVNVPLIGYYARNGIPPPLYLQRVVKGPSPAGAVAALEAACAAGSARIKEYVAGLLGMAESRVVVPTLLGLLGDEHPAVRTAAARALAGFPTDKVKERLFAALTDDRFGVLKAVAETLGSFSLQRESQALVRMFAATGKRVPKAAAELVARCEAAPGVFAGLLVNLGAQDEPTRGALALVLKRLYQDDGAVGRLVMRLCSADRAAAAATAREVVDRLAGFLPA